MKVLLVDDDSDVLLFLELGLRKRNIETISVSSREDALKALEGQPSGSFDLIILDVRLHDESGMDLLNEVRHAGDETPVIFISGDERVKQKVAGFTLGADDYIVKPVDIDELVARMEAVLRRRAEVRSIDYGEVSVDLARRRVSRAGRRIDLSPREFDLLLALVRAKGNLVSREELLREVWDIDFDPGTNVLDVHVGRLRRKLDSVGRPLIHNRRGKGYCIRSGVGDAS